jgi:hypothetical protein
MIKHARSESEKTLLVFEKRLYKSAREDRLLDLFSTEDGVDNYEAWLLAKAYSEETFGSCGRVGLPERKGAVWVAPHFGGRASSSEVDVVIDAKSGRLTCAGNPSVDAPDDFLRKHSVDLKNQRAGDRQHSL